MLDKLLKHIIKDNKLCDKVKHYRNLKSRINEINRQIESVKVFYDNELKKLKADKEQIQNQCDHPVFSFFGDPSGGNDSFNKCDVCEKIF